MVDPGNFGLHMVIIADPQLIEQGRGTDLDAVAEADGPDGRLAQHGPGQHGHGIGVVEKPGVRADLLHVAGKVHHDRNGPEGAEDTADPQRIRDRLPQAVFFGDLKIRDRTGIIPSDLDGIDYIVGAAQGILSRIRAQITADPGFGPVIAVDCLQHGSRLLEPDRINIIESDLTLLQGGGHHAVPQHIFCENCGSRSHECNFRHSIPPSL